MSNTFEALNLCGPYAERPVEFSQQKVRAIVVDDSCAMLEVICATIEIDGFAEVVGTAADGAEAVQVVATLRPQLVVMDVNMPGMNGLEAARLLAKYFPHTQVLMMSGEESPELRARCNAAGAAGFVFKVGFPEEFPPTVRALFPHDGPCFTA
jgi:DNA-binding NarL/FixJ family response regulator